MTENGQRIASEVPEELHAEGLLLGWRVAPSDVRRTVEFSSAKAVRAALLAVLDLFVGEAPARAPGRRPADRRAP